MSVNISNHNVFITESETSILKCLVNQIKALKVTQVLVTGPMARNLYWKDTKEFERMLNQTVESDTDEKKCSYCGTVVLKKNIDCHNCGKEVFNAHTASTGWSFFGPPYNPSHKAINESLDSFANTLKHEPRTPHIYIGPTDEKEVVKRLFFPSPLHSYKCAIYLLGINEEPLIHLNTISRAVSRLPQRNGIIASIFSISDVSITDQFKRRIAIAQERQEDIRKLTLLYFRYLENIKWLEPESINSTNKKFIRKVKKSLKKEIIPMLYPQKYFPEMKPW
jgi:hypothetical protein